MLVDTYDYWAWRFRDRTVVAHSFVVVFDSIEGSDEQLNLTFTEDSAATVLDSSDRPVLREAHSRNKVVWQRESGRWSQVAGAELEVLRTVNGAEVPPESDPVGIAAYRTARSESH